MHRLHLLSLFLILQTICSAQVISMEVEVSDGAVIPHGVSTEFLYPILRGQPNADTSAYDSIWWSEAVLDEISTLDMGFLRFPGGTISQYYHATGAHGYGTRSSELDCRPGFIDIPGFRQKVRVDGAYPDNMINYYIELHKELEARQGREIESLYVINMMTHFFNGDFWDINPLIDALIAIHGAGFEFYLDNSPAFLTPEQTGQAAQIMRAVYEDPLMDNIIQAVIAQPGFQERLNENLAAIQYLIQNDIPVRGVELGNENYSFTMLKDDDLSDIEFDCTTPDSLVTPYLPLSLPLKAYMQGVIKFGFLAEIYDFWIDELYDLPTGMVMHGSSFKIQPVNGSYEIEALGGENPRFFKIWNRFLGQLDFYDGAIVHIYAKSQPDCSILEETTTEDVESYGKGYFDFYFDEVLDYQIDRLREETGREELWVTEWNMNTANIFGNTFQHAHFIGRFMDAMNRKALDGNLKFVGLHNLAAWRYNQFAVFRTDEFDSEFMMERQSVYHPYQQLSGLRSMGFKPVGLNMASWLGESWQGAPQEYYFPYYNAETRQLYLYFIHQTGSMDEFKWDHIRLIDNEIPETEWVATSTFWDFVEGSSVLASNAGCEMFPELFEDYDHITGASTAESIAIGPYATGSITLQLDIVNTVDADWDHQSKVYPNPAGRNLYVDLKDKNQQDLHYKLFNSTGQVVRNGALTSNDPIPIHDLVEGYYQFVLYGENNGVQESHSVIITNR